MATRSQRQRSRRNEDNPADASVVSLRDWATLALGLVAASTAIAVAILAYVQWDTLHKIQTMLDRTQRPWIAAAVEPVGLKFDDKGGELTLKTTLKNSGPTPAVDILSGTLLLLKTAQQPYRGACANYGVGGGVGPMLSTGETLERTATTSLPRGDFGQNFPALVAICIKYRFAGSSQTGETGYLFSLVRHDPPRPDLYFIDSKSGTLSPPELALMPIASYQD